MSKVPATVVLLATVGLACSNAPSGDDEGTGATGGGGTPAAGTGGGGSGMVGTAGGTGGTLGATGGSSNAAGTSSQSAGQGGSGLATGGAATGGAPVTGGATSSGGAPATGGVGGGAGVPGSGGLPNAGSGGTSGAGGGQPGGAGGAGGAAAGAAGTGAGGAPACTPPTGAPTAELITFNDNGGWCWYQDERVVVDTKNNRLVLGSMASGGSRNGNVEAVVYDLAAKKGTTTVLNKLSIDDHNVPGFVITASGSIAAMWATHRENCNSYFATLDGATWSSTKTYSWSGDGCPWAGASTNMVTYANPWLMSSDSNRIISAVRSVDTSPGLLSSTDDGKSWSFYGRITASPQQGYVAGYYKYWGNGVDRIDWVGTDAHPRDADNSLWHGYIKGGQVYDSFDKAVDTNVKDKTGQNVDKFTAVFKTGTTINSVRLEHMWNHDLVRYADGTIVVLGQGRVSGTGTDDPDKRHIYSRFDGKAWTTTYLVKSGPKLYNDEQDYTGLSAAHPDNPNVIFVSTPYDPRDDKTKSAKREIWQGTTCDGGKTFTWTPVTQNSSADNIRPVVPKWDTSHTALLWMQGTYRSAQDYSMKIVGMLLDR